MAAAAEIKVGKKRGNSKAESLSKLLPPSKRVSLGKVLAPPQRDLSLAKSLLENYAALEQAMQAVILEAIDDRLQQDPLLVQQALTQQVNKVRDTATKLYDSHQQVALDELLASCSPAAAILLNLQISLSN